MEYRTSHISWPGGHFVVLGLIILCLTSVDCEISRVDAEKEMNRVEIIFYSMAKSKWTSEVESKFKAVLSDKVTSYCQLNHAKCGLTVWHDAYAFQPSNVNLTGGYPKTDKRKLIVSFYVNFNTGVPRVVKSSTIYVLNKGAVLTSTEQSVDKIRDEIGYSIIDIDGKEQGLPPDNRLNLIIIIIACIVVVIVIIVAIALYCWSEHRQKMEARQMKWNLKRGKEKDKQDSRDEKRLNSLKSTQEKKAGGSPGKGKVAPSPEHDADVEKGASWKAGMVNGSPKHNNRKPSGANFFRADNDYHSHPNTHSLDHHNPSSDDPPPKYNGANYEGEVVAVPDVGSSYRAGGLPPLENPTEEGEREKRRHKKKKDKKKKKKKKHSKHNKSIDEEQGQSQQNAAYVENENVGDRDKLTDKQMNIFVAPHSNRGGSIDQYRASGAHLHQGYYNASESDNQSTEL